MLRGLETAFLASDIQHTLHALLEAIGVSTAAGSATLILPIELAYALGINQGGADIPGSDSQFEEERLVTIVARWSKTDAEAPCAALDPPLAAAPWGAGALLPFVYEDEPLGWVRLYHPTLRPLELTDPIALRQITALMTALLVWLREQVQREQQAQQSVRMLVQQAHQMRSNSMTDLLAGLAHELNNPISAMVGMAELLRRDTSLSEAARADIEAIATEAHRIGEFVKRLSNFGNTTGTTKVPLKLNEVVADTIAVIGGLAQQRQVTLQCVLPTESPVVLGNRAQLQQVCLDLISNALEAIETSDEPVITAEVACDGKWALVRISDNGYGIPEDLRERIFAPGFTTKISSGTRRGLGIGLPMALEIARNHWGTIGVTSQVWQGSCFTLRLPVI